MTTLIEETGSEAAPAASPLETYKASLAPALSDHRTRLFEFSQTEIDRIGEPLWTVALLGDDDALSDGFGYGASMQIAQTSAWGETVEWWGAREMLRRLPRVTGSYAELQARGLNAIDPVSLNLSAGSAYTPEMPLTWVETRRYPSDETALVPIEFVAPRRADIGNDVDPRALLAVPITNGSGAGPSFAHALAHGILELLQRDGNSVNYRAMDRGVKIDLDDVRDLQTRTLLRHLDEIGIEIIAKLAATDFGMANLYVVGYDRNPDDAPQPIMLSACGEAVHPDREVALAKALREFVSARARKAFNHGPLSEVRRVASPGYLESFGSSSLRSEDRRALLSMEVWTQYTSRQFYQILEHKIYRVTETVKFSDLPTTTTANANELLALLTERLNASALEILYADLTPPGSPATILKVIVPGLEVETMTYRRIGARNLRRLLEQGSPIVGQGDASEGALPILLTEQDESELGPAWMNPAALNHAMGPLYALYREPGRHVIGLLEEMRQRQETL